MFGTQIVVTGLFKKTGCKFASALTEDNHEFKPHQNLNVIAEKEEKRSLV